jgi:hypothetical protein
MGRNLIHLRHETALIKEIRGKFNKMKIYLLRARMVVPRWLPMAYTMLSPTSIESWSSKSIITLETNIQLLLFLLICLVWNGLFNVYFQITFRGRELTKPLKFNLTLLILREVLTSRELWRHSWKNQPHHEHGGEREIGSTVCWAESSAKFPTKYLRPPILWQRYSGRN